ncbi:hypothetical protein CSKR_106350 [Clonorchis sinensis]|uniref:Uncharacterized protein n=1 Tax=Clonorchis sinensis TaxID=79923 RepID=A0A3R7H442_CLOSI|nr:hypothetical protein CSKR_106350 [Clonorchis sinensis]
MEGISEIHSFAYQFGFDGRLSWNPTESLIYDDFKQPNVRHQTASCFRGQLFILELTSTSKSNAPLIKLLKTPRQATTGSALHVAHQIGGFPEVPSNLCST